MSGERSQSTRDGEARVLGALAAVGPGSPMTLTELAQATGLHPNAARRNLARLVDAGRVHVDTSGPRGPGRGRPPLRYRLVASDAMAYRELMPLVLALLTGGGGAGVGAVDDAYRAGRAYGRANAPAGDPVEALRASLVALGFAPADERVGQDGSTRMELTRCPFADMVGRAGGRALCELHHGMLAGIAEARGGTLEAFEVTDPNVGHCRVAVAPGPPAG